MRDPSSKADGLVVHPAITTPHHVSDAAAGGEHFCQMYDLIAARNGRLASQGALARAHESIVQLRLQLEAERRARRHAEATSRADQHACEEAMQLLETTAQPLRELRNAEAELRAHVEQQARALAEAEARCEAAEAKLKEAEIALARAEYSAYRHAQRHAQIARALQKERSALEDAEAKLHAERLAREEAVQALRGKDPGPGFWIKLRRGR